MNDPSTTTTLLARLKDIAIKASAASDVGRFLVLTEELMTVRDQLDEAQSAKRLVDERARTDDPDALKAFNEWLIEGIDSSSSTSTPTDAKSSSALVFKPSTTFRGNGAFTTKPLEKGEVALRLPFSHCIRTHPEDLGDDSTFTGSLAKKSPLFANNPSVQLAMSLLAEFKRGPSSRFAPYLSILPRRFPTLPMAMSYPELRLLKSSPIVAQAAARVVNVVAYYLNLSEKFPEFFANVTLRDFSIAMYIVTTRQNPITCAAPDRASTCACLALIPGFDMVNHASEPCVMSADHTDAFDGMVLYANRAFARGEEFTMHYGFRGDAELLIYSGFVPRPPGCNLANSSAVVELALRRHAGEDDRSFAARCGVLQNNPPSEMKEASSSPGTFVFVVRTTSESEGLNKTTSSSSSSSNAALDVLKLFVKVAAAETKEEVGAALRAKLARWGPKSQPGLALPKLNDRELRLARTILDERAAADDEAARAAVAAISPDAGVSTVAARVIADYFESEAALFRDVARRLEAEAS